MKPLHLLLASSLIALSSAAVSSLAWASDSATSQGLAIAQARKAADEGWQSSSARLQMILRNSQGQSSERALRIQTLEVADDGDKGLTIFDEPLDVKGTAFLNISHVNTADDQWLYLPALKRVKRIASQNKSGPFMGSEFAYEDLSSFEVEKYHYTLLGEPTVEGEAMYQLEHIPTDSFSGYSKQIVWLDKAHYRVHKVAFYDRKGALLKTLSLSQYKQYLGQYWRAHHMLMQNHQTGKVTELITQDLAFKVALNDADFNQAALRRVR